MFSEFVHLLAQEYFDQAFCINLHPVHRLSKNSACLPKKSWEGHTWNVDSYFQGMHYNFREMKA